MSRIFFGLICLFMTVSGLCSAWHEEARWHERVYAGSPWYHRNYVYWHEGNYYPHYYRGYPYYYHDPRFYWVP